ncbi:hypothetical protein H1Q63_27995 [Desmonostoc muscorum CCALA 125]|nr:hypothetical protein [Desmonostoc muscorum CCALA 125]
MELPFLKSGIGGEPFVRMKTPPIKKSIPLLPKESSYIYISQQCPIPKVIHRILSQLGQLETNH